MEESKLRVGSRIVVQKYGGTSVATPARIKKIAEFIKKRKRRRIKQVIVVSARGDKTDELIALAKSISQNPDKRELDQLLSTGEKESAALLAMALQAIGVKAVSFDAQQLGLETSQKFGEAKIKKLKEKDRVFKLLTDCVIIMAGFQGIAEGTSEITTLGRGGSDASAVAMAVSLNAEQCEIYTDVDGIFAVDPRLVPGAKKFRQISYDQMINLAAAGAGIMMDRSVKIAQVFGMPIYVMMSPSIGKTDGGTVIACGGEITKLEDFASTRGIAVKKGLAALNINNISNEPGRAKNIFAELKDFNIIEAVQGRVDGKIASLTILLNNEDAKQAVSRLLKKSPKTDIKLSENLVLLTLIDPLMKEDRGYFYKVSSSLGRRKINIEIITSSQSAIGVAVRENAHKKAAQILARDFQLIEN